MPLIPLAYAAPASETKGCARVVKLLIANHHMQTLAGSELHTADLCRGFRRAGHEVTLFTPVPGAISETLAGEGFRIYSLADLRAMSVEDFNLVYLHHSTCEAILGPIFAGKTPVVRGHLGYVPELERPLSYGSPSGRVFNSENVMEVLGRPKRMPSTVARNVYDDALVPAQDVEGPPEGPPSFAVVTNHLDTDLEIVLKEAEAERLLSYTLFGVKGRSVPVNVELLTRFDAVLTIGRTVILAAAMGKPVYIADIHGSDGWLHPDNYGTSQWHNFSGRARGLKNQRTVREELLDRRSWPGIRELIRLRELVAEDHALSRRVEELERFFSSVMETHHPDTASATDGRLGIIDFAEVLTNKALAEQRRIANQAHRLDLQSRQLEHLRGLISKSQERLSKSQERLSKSQERLSKSQERLSQNRGRIQLLENRNEEQRRQIAEMKASRTWKVVRKIATVRQEAKAVLWRKRLP